MKLKLLTSTLILSACTSVFGQGLVFTEANQPANGSSRTMLQLDYVEANFANISQINNTSNRWDYSGVNIGTATVVVGAAAASSHVNAADFPNATQYLTTGNLQTFISSSATERRANGFVYSELIGTDPIAIPLNGSGQLLMNYPFAVGNTLNNTYTGSLTVNIGAPIQAVFSGAGTVSYTHDNGSIELEDNTVINGVSRVVYRDTAFATTVMGAVRLQRESIEYYKSGEGELPIMMETNIILYVGGNAFQNNNQIFIDQAYLSYASTTKTDLFALTIAPNPSNGEFRINGDFAQGKVTVTDIQGKEVINQDITAGASLKIEAGTGVYFVSITTEKGTQTQKVVVQ